MTEAKKNTRNPQKLATLTKQVEGMSSVFDEANKAREEQRRMMDERHADVLRRISSTRDYIQSESRRLHDTLKSFQSKFTFDLNELNTELFKALNTSVAEVRSSIQEVETQLTVLEKDLVKEREERIKSTEEILISMRRQADRLTEGLEKETKIRIAREEEMTKFLQDTVEDLHRTLDTEKFRREQEQMALKEDLDSEQQRLAKRQYQIEKFFEAQVKKLKLSLEEETQNRNDMQDDIVDSVTRFIMALQDNIKDEAKMG